MLCNLDDKNHMPKDEGLKYKIFNQLIKIYIQSFNLINMDLSNLFIFQINLYFIENMSLLFKINLKNVELIYVNIWAEKKQYIKINEAQRLGDVRIENIYFEDITFFTERISNSIFKDCDFINVKFEKSILYRNIFQGCIFENCNDIDFDKLKRNNNHFINCTNDGKKFR